MIALPPTVRVYAAAEPVDLRKGFDALAAVVREVLMADPLSGQLFLFFNRRANSSLTWPSDTWKDLEARDASWKDVMALLLWRRLRSDPFRRHGVIHR